jgi:hypothetical protein
MDKQLPAQKTQEIVEKNNQPMLKNLTLITKFVGSASKGMTCNLVKTRTFHFHLNKILVFQKFVDKLLPISLSIILHEQTSIN